MSRALIMQIFPELGFDEATLWGCVLIGVVNLAVTAIAAPLSDQARSPLHLSIVLRLLSPFPPPNAHSPEHTSQAPFTPFPRPPQVGRRPLLIASYAGMSACLFAVSIITFFQDLQPTPPPRPAMPPPPARVHSPPPAHAPPSLLLGWSGERRSLWDTDHFNRII